MADFDFQQTAQDLQDFVNRTPAEIAELRALYEALTQTGVTPVAADDWPVSDPQEKVIYRVAGTSSYTDYMWNGTEFIPMATYTNTPTDIPAVGSTDVITAGGVANHGSAFDISEYNKNGATLATYADLSAALEAVPSTVQKGGMSIKFVQSNDNKYVQYRLMANQWSTTVSDWQGVDDVPTADSNNLVKSGGAYDSNADLARELFGESLVVYDYYVNINSGVIARDTTHRAFICKVTPQNTYIIRNLVPIGNLGCVFSKFPVYGKTPEQNGYLGNIANIYQDNPFTITYNDCNYIMFSILTANLNGKESIEVPKSVIKVRDELASTCFATIPYVSQMTSKYINTAGALVNGAASRSIQIFQVTKGDLVKIEGYCQGASVASWALYADANLTTLLHVGMNAELFQPTIYQCESNGYIGVCSFVSSYANKLTLQTMYVSKVMDTKSIAEKTSRPVAPYKVNGEISITWIDGYLVWKSNGTTRANANYCYAMIDCASINSYALKIRSAIRGGIDVCRIGCINNKGQYSLIEPGFDGTESVIDVVIKPSEYDMKFIILCTQIARKDGCHLYGLDKAVDKSDIVDDKPVIICEGDSLVEWSSPYSISTAITSELGYPTVNTAKGGENSLCITARDGAIPMFVTGLNKGSLTIGGSTSRIEVELWDEFCTKRLNMRTTSSNISLSKLYIGGKSFTLSIEGTVPPDSGSGEEPDFSNVHYYITPDELYDTQTFDTPALVVTYAAKNFRGYIPLVQFGANDAINLSNYEERAPKVIARHKAIINYHNTDDFFVLGMYPIGLTNLAANEEIQKMYWEEFGYRFIDIRQYLVDYGLQLVGITPTAGDLEDIAVGVVPRSLRLAANTHHLTDDAQEVMCNYVVERVKYFMQNE